MPVEGNMVGTMTTRLVDEYLRECVVTRRHAKSTQRTARYVLAGFARACPPDPKRIQRRHVIAWMDQDVEDSTLATKFGMVRSFLQWANGTGRIPKDPSRGIDPPKRPRRIPRALDPDEVVELLASAPNPRVALAISLMVCEGLRISEVCRLQIGDVDWRHLRVHVVQGKGGKDRAVHLSPATATAIRHYLAVAPASSGTLIRSEHDNRSPITPNRLGRLVTDHMVDRGVKERARDGKSSHAFRHTYGSDLVDAGATLPEVADLMGHADVSTTMIYQRNVDLERTRAAANSRPYAGALRAVAAAVP